MREVLAAVEAGQDSLVTGVAELVSGIVQASTRRLDVPESASAKNPSGVRLCSRASTSSS